MAGLVLSGLNLKPLNTKSLALPTKSSLKNQPRNTFFNLKTPKKSNPDGFSKWVLNVKQESFNLDDENPSKIPFLSLKTPKKTIFSKWVLNVSAPFKVPSLDEQERLNLDDEEEEESSIFDAGAKPGFKLSDVRGAIPKHCWVKDPVRSMSYVVRDVAVVIGLAAFAGFVNSWFVWPLYWAAQGTMFWALFVLGHDCGHGSFSSNPKLNSVVGHLLHSSILVPYHG